MGQGSSYIPEDAGTGQLTLCNSSMLLLVSNPCHLLIPTSCLDMELEMVYQLGHMHERGSGSQALFIFLV